MRRFHYVAVIAIVWAAVAMAQDAVVSRASGEWNSVSPMLLERVPQLQAGFGSDEDQWLLYSKQFDFMSHAAQQFLLQKYGYQTPRAGALSRPLAPMGLLPRRPALAPGVNVKVTPESNEIGRRLQSETTIAAGGQNLVVGYNDGNQAGTGVSYSNDGGSTWRTSRLPAFPGQVATSGDPVVVAAPNGRFYFSYLAPTGAGFLAIAVARSDDGGATWVGPSNAAGSLGGSNGGSHDKEWMAVDNSTSQHRGNVYVCWTRFGTAASPAPSIRLVRSTDGGLAWSNAQVVATLALTETFDVIQGCNVVTGPAGEVYVAWYDSRVAGIRVRKSIDGGVTFSDPVTALAPVGFAFSLYLPGTFDLPAFPSMAVDTTNGPNRSSVYVVCTTRSSAGDTDVTLARSADGGATFQTVRVNEPSLQEQYMPSVAVAEDGSVGVAFYDRRIDPVNNTLNDLALAISNDAGRTFALHQRVTTSSWPLLPTPFGYRTGYHSDYNHIVSVGNNFYMSWGDDRNGTDADTMVAVASSAGGGPFYPPVPANSHQNVLAGESAVFLFEVPSPLFARSSPPGLTLQVIPGSPATQVIARTTTTTPPGTYTITVWASRFGVELASVSRVTVHSSNLRRPPEPVTPIRDPAHTAHASTDAAGNVHLVSIREVISRAPKRITYSRIAAGTRSVAFESTVFRADDAGREQTIFDPHVASYGGRVYVVFERQGRTGNHVLFASSADGRNFQITDLSKVAAPDQGFYPSIAVGLDGTVYVSFILRAFTVIGNVAIVRAQDIFLTRSTDGGATFSPFVTVSGYRAASPTLQLLAPPVLTLDTRGNPHVVWTASTPGAGVDVWYARSQDGGASFSAPVNVSAIRNATGQVIPRHAALAVDTRNTVYVVWNTVDPLEGQRDIFLATSTDGLRFGAALNVSSATRFSGALTDWPAVAVDGNGVLTVAWRQWVNAPFKGNDTNRDIYMTQCFDRGTRCSTPFNVSTSLGDTLLAAGFSTANPPGLTLDNDGRVFLFYDDDTAGATQIYLVTFP